MGQWCVGAFRNDLRFNVVIKHPNENSNRKQDVCPFLTSDITKMM